MIDKQILFRNNRALELSKPIIMGIINLTNDSFYDGGRFTNNLEVIDYAGRMISQGASIIDIGAMSTKPFSTEIDINEEWERLEKIIASLRKKFPETIISIDTYRSEVAKRAISTGADMINDISGGEMDKRMIPLIAKLNVPYVLMHIQGTPKNMQQNPHYKNIEEEIFNFFSVKLNQLQDLGYSSTTILDPGLGFGKTVEHNYTLLNSLKKFKELNCPVMAGVSRKSMINKVLNITPSEALNGTTVLNTISLLNGADMLRVHDVAQAREVIELTSFYNKCRNL